MLDLPNQWHNCFFILEILIKERLARFSCLARFNLKWSKKLGAVRWGGHFKKKFFSMYYSHSLMLSSSNLNQHQLSVFLRIVYSIRKRATSLLYLTEWGSLSGAPNRAGQIWSLVQISTKKCKKVRKVQICISSITLNIF